MNGQDEVVLVEVIDGKNTAADSGEPGDNCGSTGDWREKTRELSRELQKVYEDRVKVKYVDIEEAGIENYLVVEEVRYLGFRYPIVLLNGQPLIAGGIIVNEVIKSINELLNMPEEY
jgi:disulfide oxidoreductase YuzD